MTSLIISLSYTFLDQIARFAGVNLGEISSERFTYYCIRELLVIASVTCSLQMRHQPVSKQGATFTLKVNILCFLVNSFNSVCR